MDTIVYFDYKYDSFLYGFLNFPTFIIDQIPKEKTTVGNIKKV